MKLDSQGFSAYRIGGKKRRSHWAHRWHVDFWFRGWQAEWDGCQYACRAWTRTGVLRKARRWYRNGTDWGQIRRARMRGEGPHGNA